MRKIGMFNMQYITIYGDVYSIHSTNIKIFRDFEFAMREYLTPESISCNVCDLDICTVFDHEVFKKRFLVMTGCAYLYQNRVSVFLAPHYSGKTSLVYEAIRCGAQLITDDLVIIDRSDSTILPLHKPICFRESLLERTGLTKEFLQQNMIQHRFFADDYGPRLLFHPFDYLIGEYSEIAMKISDIYIQNVQNVTAGV